MKRSDERIISTHVGSLPRPGEVLESIDKPDDDSRKVVDDAVVGVVEKQVDCGLDVVNDGEFSKPGFWNYVWGRLSGFEVVPPEESEIAAAGPAFMTDSRESEAFPNYYKRLVEGRGDAKANPLKDVRCRGELSYSGQDALRRDIDNLKSAAAGLSCSELFMTSIAVSDVAGTVMNEYYPDEDAYLLALADVLHEEYKAIVDAGLLLQIDDPKLVTHWIEQKDSSVGEAREWAEKQVEVLNHALRGIPPERVRYHTCYSIDIGPRVHDMELKDVVDIILRVNAGAYSFEAANPRHEHEWRVWEDVSLPDGKILIPGVITNSTVLVEHPEVVAERITRFAEVVGRENVIAGADCGFSSMAGNVGMQDADIVWAKLSALAAGAALASSRLWG